jgi:hypothetical protein
MTLHESYEARLAGDDRQLVDLVTAVLVDPNVHTDTRMRLAEEIAEVLRSADEDLYHRCRHEVHTRTGGTHEPHRPQLHGTSDMLASVLVDPNLHTDTRMRIHREISEILRAESARDCARPSEAARG